MTSTLNPRILGQAENAHRALLDRILDDAGRTHHDWIGLKLAAVGGAAIDREMLAETMASALKIGHTAARESIDALQAEQLIETVPGDGSRLRLTKAGQELHGEIRTAVEAVTARLYRDIPAADLATAGKVLVLVTERANADLAGANS